jgi:hypothetical protein
MLPWVFEVLAPEANWAAGPYFARALSKQQLKLELLSSIPDG